MQSNEKISPETLQSAMGETNTLKQIKWNGLKIQVARTLSLTEVLQFVQDVISLCFDSEAGEYHPELEDFAIRRSTINLYTNIQLPEEADPMYDILCRSDLYDAVCSNIDHVQYDAILDATNKRIATTVQGNISAVSKQMNELINQFNTLEENMAGVFGGLDGETISNISSAFSDGGLDENKLVSAVMEYNRTHSEE